MVFLEKTIKKAVREPDLDRNRLEKIKRSLAKEYEEDLPSNMALLKRYRRLVENDSMPPSPSLEKTLIKRPVRSLSGIVNVSVLTKPFPCPGRCIFCPLEPGLPKSYLAGEPAADRALRAEFDPYLQTKSRLHALRKQGHPTDKVELRIVGGTWSFYPHDYRERFVKECFRAANDLPGPEGPNLSLQETFSQNEGAQARIVGLSVETRCDHVNGKEVKHLRRIGATMVELGVQTLSERVHALNKTGTTLDDIVRATRLLKEAGFKILYQMMPGLYGSDPETDLQTFDQLFEDERFKPDWLKVYPCVVLDGTPLHRLYKEGEYEPYQEDDLVLLLSEIKKKVPRWTRVARIYRDIPAPKIEGGSTTGHIRQLAQRRLKKEGKRCLCIRCREVRTRFDPDEEIKMMREDYRASGGQEVFLSFENENRSKLFSYLRLRRNRDGSAVIRELQTLGPQTEIAEKSKGAQHRGLGSRLVQKAEEVAFQEFGTERLDIISGVGVRDYYRAKHGYRLKNTYMTLRHS